MEINSKIEEQGVYKGFEYEVKATSLGVRCGYVKLPIKLDAAQLERIECHGGINYITDNVIGFDCFHVGDTLDESILSKELLAKLRTPFWEGKKWTTEDVRLECYHIIDQLQGLIK